MATMAVLGSGAWGTAVAAHLARLGHAVTLWAARPPSAARLAADRENRRLLPGIPIPPEVAVTADPAVAAADADLWVVAVPTAYLRETLPRLGPAGGVPVLSLTKGLERGSFRRPTEVIAEVTGAAEVACLSGPSHAEEVGRGLPASVVVASAVPDLAGRVQGWFNGETLRVYTNPDIVGVELAGALKNVIAIAAGISDGLGFGDNAKAALLTRSLVEMARFGVALGGDRETFSGLAGLGDLITTCVSPHGRNRRVGERLGRGEKLADILAGSPTVAEGVPTCRSVYERAGQLGLEMPITAAVHAVLYEGRPPAKAVRDLMTRQPTCER
jgi:glycerol-3-phosphate dehydrogenase (NAD(P)+)